MRKGEKNNLSQMKSRYRGLLDAAPDAIVVVNQGGEIVLLNAQAEKQFGYHRDELVGQKVKNIIPGGFAERLIADGLRSAAEALAQQMGMGIELTGLRKDKSEFPIEIMLSPLESAEGILVTAAIRDISARTKAEKHLAQLEGRYPGLMEVAPDAMVISDSNGRIVMVNVETERLFRYTREELVGRLFEVLLPERFRDKHREHRQGYTANPRTRLLGESLELWGLRKDASEFPVEISLRPLETQEGLCIANSIRDATQRRRIEQALRESEECFRLMVSNVKDCAIVMLDPEGRVISWNEGAERTKGYRAEEIVGHQLSVFYTAEDMQRGKPAFALEIAAKRGFFEDEGWRVRKDGSRFWAHVVLTALRDENGRLRGFGKITRDITGRKEAEEALRASEETLRLAVEAAEMGTWSWNLERDEIHWSERFRALLGLSPQAKLNYQGFLDATHPGDRWRLDRSFKGTLQQGAPYDIEFRAVWPDSSVHWIAAKGRAQRNPEGIAVDMQGIVMDVTERKNAEETLRRQEATERRTGELKRSNDDLQQFAYVAAHDLQEPLRMVASYTQLLAQRYKGRLDSDADEFIAFAVDGAHRMQLLIADLLAYCRVETKGKELRETAAEGALAQALLNLQSAVQESGGVVTHDPLPTVFADGAQLVQLFQNLVGNAIKYHGAESPRIHISAKNEGDEWIFSVRDNGMGIDTMFFEKVFVMFQRLHGREEFSGTGIGLTVCKKIVERHRGRIWVESEPGKGSTFYFALPAKG
jgi:PAS domain S-box-containing protein